MSTETEQFRQLLVEKSEAKAKVLIAVGAAKVADPDSREAADAWAIVAEQGIDGGVEGEKMAALQALADSYVTDHPELFVTFEPYANPDGHEQLVTMVSILRESGFEDEATLATMFELARFKRQQIGVVTKAEVRLPGGKA